MKEYKKRMEAIIITAIFGVAAALDFVPRLKKETKLALWVYGAILLLGYVNILIVSLGHQPPSPWQPVLALVENALGL
jgi:hypothetical protein